MSETKKPDTVILSYEAWLNVIQAFNYSKPHFENPWK